MRVGHRLVVVLTATAAALTVGACGASSSESVGTTTTTSTTAMSTSPSTSTTPTSTTTTTMPPTSTTTSTRPVSESDAAQLARDVQSLQARPFTATWARTTGTRTVTLVLAERPPNEFYFDANGSLTVSGSDGTDQCTVHTRSCYAFKGGSLVGVAGAYDGTVFTEEAAAYSSAVDRASQGISLSYSHGVYWGQASTCVHAVEAHATTVWCVSNSTDVITYWSSDGASFTLTHFTFAPPAAYFRVPAGYTIKSL